LVVLDANLLFGAASDIARMLSLGRTLVPDGVEMPISMPPEMIVVGIGYPAEDPQSVTIESSKRRMYDFTHLADNLGPEGERLRQPLLHYYPEGIPYGGAADFLDMIQGPLAEELGQRYRINPGCSILFGASAGATFATYVLLERPSAFSHYIVASPSLYLCGEDLFQKEASYAADNSDLAANVFISFGARELDLFAQAAIASSATRLAELLTRRNYPGLVLKTAIFQDETHARACLSGLARGLDHLFGAS
jgi:predicted alpha/beta superfamily hydrolase